jgi:hypothetical protein
MTPTTVWEQMLLRPERRLFLLWSPGVEEGAEEADWEWQCPHWIVEGHEPC